LAINSQLLVMVTHRRLYVVSCDHQMEKIVETFVQRQLDIISNVLFVYAV